MKSAAKKITVNIPAELMEEAMGITKKGITPTIVEGLEELKRRQSRSLLKALKGKVTFKLDLTRTRK